MGASPRPPHAAPQPWSSGQQAGCGCSSDLFSSPAIPGQSLRSPGSCSPDTHFPVPMCQERFCFSRSPTCAFSAESAEARPAACGCESRFRKSRLKQKQTWSKAWKRSAPLQSWPLLGFRHWHSASPAVRPQKPAHPNTAWSVRLGSWRPARPSASDASHRAQPGPLEGRDSSRSTEGPGSPASRPDLKTHTASGQNSLPRP